jgi:hypothetical protein
MPVSICHTTTSFIRRLVTGFRVSMGVMNYMSTGLYGLNSSGDSTGYNGHAFRDVHFLRARRFESKL